MLRLMLLCILSMFAVLTLSNAPASAACRQVFTNTTCTFGPWGKCTNHFQTVCSEPVVKHHGGASPAGAGKPVGLPYSQAVSTGMIKPMNQCNSRSVKGVCQ